MDSEDQNPDKDSKGKNQDEFLFDDTPLSSLPLQEPESDNANTAPDNLDVEFKNSPEAWADTLLGELEGECRTSGDHEIREELEVEFRNDPDSWEETQHPSLTSSDQNSHDLSAEVPLKFNESSEMWEETQVGGINVDQIPVLDDVVDATSKWDPTDSPANETTENALQATPDLAATLREVIDQHLPDMISQAVEQSLDQVRDNISLQIQEQVDLKLITIIEQVLMEFRKQQEIDDQN